MRIALVVLLVACAQRETPSPPPNTTANIDMTLTLEQVIGKLPTKPPDLHSAEEVDLNHERYEESCHKNQDDCAWLALHYSRKGDHKRCAQMLQESCKQKSQIGCFHLGLAEASGTGVKKGEVLAFKRIKNACDAGVGDACVMLGHHYRTGSFPPAPEKEKNKKPKQVITTYVAGCTKGSRAACTQLWLDTQQDKTAFLKVHAVLTGCGLGDGDACQNLGVLVTTNVVPGPQASKAVETLEKACDAGVVKACVWIAHESHEGGVLETDLPRLHALAEATCKKGDLDGCVLLAEALEMGQGVAKDELRALRLNIAVCNAGNGRACSQGGAMFADGTGVPADPAQAFSLFKKACDGKSSTGCGNLAAAYEFGVGIEADKAKAKELYGLACEMGNKPSCK